MTHSPRYALFAGSNHRPRGGVLDFFGWFDNLESAKSQFNSLPRVLQDWADITDENLNRLYTWYIHDYLYDAGEWEKVSC